MPWGWALPEAQVTLVAPTQEMTARGKHHYY